MFEGKEQFMAKLNDFVTSNISDAKSYLSTVVEFNKENKEEADSIIPTAVHKHSLNTLLGFLLENEKELREAPNLHIDDEARTQLKQHLQLIYSINTKNK